MKFMAFFLILLSLSTFAQDLPIQDLLKRGIEAKHMTGTSKIHNMPCSVTITDDGKNIEVTVKSKHEFKMQFAHNSSYELMLGHWGLVRYKSPNEITRETHYFKYGMVKFGVFEYIIEILTSTLEGPNRGMKLRTSDCMVKH